MSTKKGGLSVMEDCQWSYGPGRPCRYPLNPSKEANEQVEVMVMASDNDPQILIDHC